MVVEISSRERVLVALRRVGRGGLLFGQLCEQVGWVEGDAAFERLLLSMRHDGLIHRSLGRWRFGVPVVPVVAVVEVSRVLDEQVVQVAEIVKGEAVMAVRYEAMLETIDQLINEHMTRADELIRQREQLLEVMA